MGSEAMLHLANLDEPTRESALAEIEYDISRNRLYLSPRLSPRGRKDWPGLLRDALRTGDDGTLAAHLRLLGRLMMSETRRTERGRIVAVEVPETAAQTLAEGEFNRFYIRGLCRRALSEGRTHLVIYRAKPVATPRPESESRIGISVAAQALLDDLRANIGVDPALGVPAGPNSGLSVRLS